MKRISLRRLSLGICAVLSACSSTVSQTPKSPLPELSRPATAGDVLWSALPHGADVVVEIDIKRLRDNGEVGRLLQVLTPPPQIDVDPELGKDVLRQVDTAVIAMHEIGDGAEQLLLLQSPNPEFAGTHKLQPGLFALGAPKLIARAAGVQSENKSLRDDAEFWNMRAEPMPPMAEFAALRAVARLDFNARVALAAQVEVSIVPTSIALWGDIVDDLAVVALLACEDPNQADRLQKGLQTLQQKLLRHRLLRLLGLSQAIRETRIERVGRSRVKLVFVLGPKALKRVVTILLQRLS